MPGQCLFRRVLAVHAVLLGLCVGACTRASVEPPFTLKQVGPDIWAAIHNAKAAAPAWANAGFVIGDDGVAVIDTFASEATATALLAEIRARTTLPVRFVINTHYHSDHVAGNRVFSNTGAIVLAHRQVRGWIHTENLRLMGPTITPEQRAATEAFVAPTVVYEHGVNLFLGSRRIQLESFPGHTGGDSIVVIPDSRVVFAGDLLFHDMLPTLVDASTRPWIDTLDALLAQYAGFTFVPGHGDVGQAQDVAAFRLYLQTLHTLVTNARAQGKSGDAVPETVMPALKEKYGHMEFFEHIARQNVLEADAEQNGTKRLPPALQ
jgi:glyoxylase-like metal-dependent hydrolase (beta-lactamase superfamily II)